MYTQIKKENFKETIKKELMSRIKGAKLYENNVVKNNVTKLGIVVNRANENISPTFYIDDLYDMYLENNSIDILKTVEAKNKVEKEMTIL